MNKSKVIKNLRKSKGITLIALVITIIVLLILAGVTINAIVGNESTMEKAKQAKEKNEQGTELDAIKLAVVNSIANGLNGLVDTNVLKNELNGLVDETSRNSITNEKTSWIVTANSGLKYKIKQNGEVTLAEPVDTVEFTETETTIKIGKSKALSLLIKGKSGNETEANSIEYSFVPNNIAEVLDNGEIKILDNVTPNTKVRVTVIADGITSFNSCEITAEENILEIGTAINADKYGYKVNGYISKAENDGETIGWRLFYQDNENTYIISDILIGNTSIGEYRPQNYTYGYHGGNISAQGKGLNPLVIDILKDALGRGGAPATSWFCSPVEWNKYTDSQLGPNAKASFSIASPSIELYVKSYNALADLNTNSLSQIAYPTIGSSGYTYSTWPNGIDATAITHNIYSKGTDIEWWLASPGRDNRWGNNRLCYCKRQPIRCGTTRWDL